MKCLLCKSCNCFLCINILLVGVKIVVALLKALFVRLSHSNKNTSIMDTDAYPMFTLVCAYVCSCDALFFLKQQ